MAGGRDLRRNTQSRTVWRCFLFVAFAFSWSSQLHHVLAEGPALHLLHSEGSAEVRARADTVEPAFGGTASVATSSKHPQSSPASRWLPAFQNLAALQRKAVKQLWPLDVRDIGMFVILAFSLSLAGGAGIGGGAILVPTFILVRQFPTATAVALSNITVLGGSFANFLWNVSRRRQESGLPLIDWELITMMEPTTIVGAVVGGYLNKLLPVWITTLLLTAMLTLMTYRLLVKACQSYRQESLLLIKLEAKRQAKHAAAAAAGDAGSPAATPAGDDEPAAATAAIAAADDDDDDDTERTPLLADKDQGSSRHNGNGPAEAKAWSRTKPLPIPSRLNGTSRKRPKGDVEDQSLSVPLLSYNGDGSTITASYGQLYSSSMPTVARRAAASPAPARAASSLGVSGILQSLRRGNQAMNGRGGHAEDEEHQQQQEGERGLRGGLAAGGRHSGPRLHSVDRRSLTCGQSYGLFQGDAIDLGPPLVAMPSDSLDSLESPGTSSSSDNGGDDSTPNGTADNAAAAGDATGAAAGAPGVHCDSSVDSPSNSVIAIGEPELTVVVTNGDAAHLHSTLEADVKGSGGPTLPPAEPPTPPGRHSPLLPLGPLGVLLVCSAWVVATDISKQHYKCGGWLYWLVTVSVLLPVTASVVGARAYLLRKYAEAVHVPGQLNWTRVTTLLYPGLCTAAGLVAGLFGIGGGVVKGPLMLELGVAADVAAATSATMIVFTAGSACVVYSRFGGIPSDYGPLLLVLGFTFTLTGQMLTFTLVKMLGRRSVIVYMMGLLMAIAAVVMYYQSGVVGVEVARHPEAAWRGGHICE